MDVQTQKVQKVNFASIFNFRDKWATGRTLFLISGTLQTTIINVFTTGTFSNGFLKMYGISVTGVSILTYVPYIATALTLLSPCVLKHFKRRKPIILLTGFINILLSYVATTLMPLYVTDPHDRLIWFVGLTIAANLISAPFSPASAAWSAEFLPRDTEKRSYYFKYTQIITHVLSLVLILVTSVVTDALNESGNQESFILTLRWVAIALKLLCVLLHAFVYEPALELAEAPRMLDVFTKPMRNKKFVACLLLHCCWALGTGINSTWVYHLQVHLHFSYTFTNICFTWMGALCNVLSLGIWRKVVGKYSWVKTMGISYLLLPIFDISAFFITGNAKVLLLVVSFCQFVVGVGSTLAGANLFYLNLPEKEDKATYFSCWTVVSSVASVLSGVIGTWITSWTGDTPIIWHGMEIYSLQFGWFWRAALAFGCGLVAFFKWKSFTPDEEIQRIEGNR